MIHPHDTKLEPFLASGKRFNDLQINPLVIGAFIVKIGFFWTAIIAFNEVIAHHRNNDSETDDIDGIDGEHGTFDARKKDYPILFISVSFRIESIIHEIVSIVPGWPRGDVVR